MNTIFQIYHDKKLIPPFVKEHIIKLNPNYKYRFIDFAEGKEIINANIKDDNLKKQILHCMENSRVLFFALTVVGKIRQIEKNSPVIKNCFFII